MRALVFKCPATGHDVPGAIPAGVVGPNTILVPVECPICRRPHLVNPMTGNTAPDDHKISH